MWRRVVVSWGLPFVDGGGEAMLGGRGGFSGGGEGRSFLSFVVWPSGVACLGGVSGAMECACCKETIGTWGAGDDKI